MLPFDVLLEVEGPAFPLPPALEEVYGGQLGFAEEVVYANFVASMDGVVALGDGRSSGSVISGRNEADRFLMALLRASAEAVVVGAGTLRATPGHLWTAEYLLPGMASDFDELRRRLGRSAGPRLVVLSGSGEVDPAHPAIEAGALVLSTGAGARKARSTLPASCSVVAVGEGDRIDIGDAMKAVRQEGHRVVLTEGGPSVMGQFLEARMLDELFLTISPVIAGRSNAEARPGFVSGVELLPRTAAWSRLLGARRHGSHLFLHYATRDRDQPRR
ncbi:MAG: dihydrofolate reductase family protein [Candidatus Dormibacteria bacterium]